MLPPSMKEEELITITKKEYELLKESHRWLGYLEFAGVDNWVGIDYAYELLREASERELKKKSDKQPNK